MPKLDMIIATDQNIDLLKVETNKASSDLFDISFTNVLYQPLFDQQE